MKAKNENVSIALEIMIHNKVSSIFKQSKLDCQILLTGNELFIFESSAILYLELTLLFLSLVASVSPTYFKVF